MKKKKKLVIDISQYLFDKDKSKVIINNELIELDNLCIN